IMDADQDLSVSRLGPMREVGSPDLHQSGRPDRPLPGPVRRQVDALAGRHPVDRLEHADVADAEGGCDPPRADSGRREIPGTLLALPGERPAVAVNLGCDGHERIITRMLAIMVLNFIKVPNK